MKILILNGPNLNLLGAREPAVYGRDTLDSIMERVRKVADELSSSVESFQSNEEGALITKIGEAGFEFDGIIINPAGYTHTSVALRDAMLACNIPCVEVHLSNIHAREDFRRNNLTAGACLAQIQGFGGEGYELALRGIVSHLEQNKTGQKKVS